MNSRLLEENEEELVEALRADLNKPKQVIAAGGRREVARRKDDRINSTCLNVYHILLGHHITSKIIGILASLVKGVHCAGVSAGRD